MKETTVKSVTEILTTGHVITAIIMVAFVWLGLKTIQYLASGLANRFSRYRIQITGIVPLLRIVIWVVTLYVVIVKIFDPPQATLVAMLASTGLAVGLAAQDVIRNVISGALILFEQPFRVGDMVNVDGHYGEVKSIGLRSISLQTFDDNTITVPNATVAAQSVSNANSGALNEMVVVTFLLPASVDIKTVKELAWEAAACSPYAYLRKPINVLVEDVFNRSFLNRFTVKAYVLDVRFERKFASDVIERVKQALLARNIVTEELVMSALRHSADTEGGEQDQPSAARITMDEKL
ncbi:MAG: mechanosensitive ion channel family protein [Gammaproteobacteria bacterium]|nr:mechanosensitive ion channel family protein [Gammaproteobacteria bacterium]